MGTSYVEVNDHGFWMRDSILELWMRLVALHMEEPTKDDSIIRPIRDQWLLGSRGYFNGCIPIDLNDDVSSDAGRKIITDAISSVLERLARAPDTLDKDVLNLLGIASGAITQNIETWRLIEVGEAFLDLIDGKITGTAESTEFMPGAATSRTRRWTPRPDPPRVRRRDDEFNHQPAVNARPQVRSGSALTLNETASR